MENILKKWAEYANEVERINTTLIKENKEYQKREQEKYEQELNDINKDIADIDRRLDGLMPHQFLLRRNLINQKAERLLWKDCMVAPMLHDIVLPPTTIEGFMDYLQPKKTK